MLIDKYYWLNTGLIVIGDNRQGREWTGLTLTGVDLMTRAVM